MIKVRGLITLGLLAVRLYLGVHRPCSNYVSKPGRCLDNERLIASSKYWTAARLPFRAYQPLKATKLKKGIRVTNPLS